MTATTTSEHPYALPAAPDVPASPFVGHLWDMKRDPLGLLMRAHRDIGDVATFTFLGLSKAVMVSDPDLVKRVFVDNHHNYGKRTRGYSALRFLLGNGLVTSEGSFWRRQRRIAQPSFHHHRIAGFADVMARLTAEQIAHWQGLPDGHRVSMDDAMMALTMRIVTETLLGGGLGEDAPRVGPALTTLLKHVQKTSLSIWRVPESWPTPSNLRVKHSLKVLDSIVHKIIERKRTYGHGNDLLSMFMEAKDEETGEGMTDLQLRDEVMTMFLAGHETTATALSWAWYFLARNPAVEVRLHDEVDRVVGDEVPRFEHLKALEYTGWVVKETMRLRPPVWMLARSAKEQDRLGDYRMPDDCKVVFISPYVVHRHPQHWDDPERFDPERFRPDAVATRHKFAYLPFAGGPRVCIGNSFALMEATLVLAQMARRFKFTTQHSGKPKPVVVLRADGGMAMRLHHRRTG